mmetsp:Transcript_10276/g.20575  ORF Transcript_10276/g.20575 Transcript_10276/m.20575 type:complete len:296 (+) Transcript_10276:316-1203(+)
MSGAARRVRKLKNIAVFINGFAIVPGLGKRGLLTERLILGMVNGTKESRAAILGAGNKVNGHDALDPLAAGELEHIITASVAARSGLDVLLANHGLEVRGGRSRGDNVELIDEGLDILHASLEIIDRVLVLELEVRFVVVDASNDEISKLPKGHEDVLMASVEKIEAADGVNLALLPTLGEGGLQSAYLIDHGHDAILQLGEDLTIKEGVRLGKLGKLLLADHGPGALVVLLQDLTKGRLVEAEELKEQIELAVEGAEGLLGVDVVLEVLRLAHPAVLILEPRAVGADPPLVAAR